MIPIGTRVKVKGIVGVDKDAIGMIHSYSSEYNTYDIKYANDEEDYVDAIMSFAESWEEDERIYDERYPSIARCAQEIMFSYSNRRVPLECFK